MNAGLRSGGRRRLDWYERALNDPDCLAEIELGPGKEEDSFFETYGYVALEVYEELTGEELPLRPWTAPAEPLGERWEDGELQTRLPRLWKATEHRS